MTHTRYSRRAITALVLAAGFAAGAAQARLALVEIQGQALPRLTTEEAHELLGNYELADGRKLSVTKTGRRLWATLDNGSTVALRALSPTRLAAADGSLTLDFVAAANGSVHSVRMTLQRRS